MLLWITILELLLLYLKNHEYEYDSSFYSLSSPFSSPSPTPLSEYFFLDKIYRVKSPEALRLDLFQVSQEREVTNLNLSSEGSITDRYGQPLPLFTAVARPHPQSFSSYSSSSPGPGFLAPDPNDKGTLLSLAKMSFNSYSRPNDTSRRYLVDPFQEVTLLF